MNRLKVYGYCRVSGPSQLTGDGLERQELEIKAFCLKEGHELVAVYQEKAVPGWVDGMERPTWVKMNLDMAESCVSVVVIERLDRLARDLMVSEHIIADIRARNIILLSTCEPDLCSSDPTRQLMRQIMSAIAQYDKQMIVLKLRGARQRQKARTGRCEGRKPYGHREGEQNVLLKMKELRNRGWTSDNIAENLNRCRILTRYGRQWKEANVTKILACAERSA